MINTLINKVTVTALLATISTQVFGSDHHVCGGVLNPCSVPEPGGLALIGAGIAAIAISRYFKSRKK